MVECVIGSTEMVGLVRTAAVSWSTNDFFAKTGEMLLSCSLPPNLELRYTLTFSRSKLPERPDDATFTNLLVFLSELKLLE